jgi:hypothetical protein
MAGLQTDDDHVGENSHECRELADPPRETD